GGWLTDMCLGKRCSAAVKRRHAARRFGPAAAMESDHRRLKWNGGKMFELAHLASVEVSGKNDPPDQCRRHDRCCDKLSRAPGKNRYARHPSIIERFP